MPLILQVAISGVLLIIVMWQVDLSTIVEGLRSYQAQTIAASVMTFLVASIIAVARWRVFVPELDFRLLLRLSFIAQFYSMLLPGQIAGEAVKAYRIAKGRAEPMRLVGSVVMDRLIGTLSLLLLGNAGALLSSRLTSPALAIAFGLLTAAIVIVVIAPGVMNSYPGARRFVALIQRRVVPSLWRRPALASLMTVWHGYAMKPSRLVVSLALGLVVNGLVIAIYAILAVDLGINVGVIEWFWIVALVALAMLIPISVAGIGVREGALIGCLAYLGVMREPALALSFGVFVLSMFGALTGWVVEVAGNFSKRS